MNAPITPSLPNTSAQESSVQPGPLALLREIKTYCRELPRLLDEEHDGKFAVIKGDEVLSVWDTANDAYQAGRMRFALGETFLVQPIDSEDMTGPYPTNFDNIPSRLPTAPPPIPGAPSAEPSPQPPIDPGLLKLQAEIKTYRRHLPRLLAEGHEGKFVLIKGDKVLSIWDTSNDVYQAGRQQFNFGEIFLAQPIDKRFLTGPYPKELDPD